jgi:hypothetical protein
VGFAPRLFSRCSRAMKPGHIHAFGCHLSGMQKLTRSLHGRQSGLGGYEPASAALCMMARCNVLHRHGPYHFLQQISM